MTKTSLSRRLQLPGIAVNLAALALVPATLPVTVPAAAPAAYAGDDGQSTLTIAEVDPTVDSLNPFTSIYALPTQIHRLMYDFLTMYTAEDATPTDGLAEDWEHSDDGTTWTYEIRDDSTFSDGEPVTAEDVEFTYNTMMERPAQMTNGNFVENFESVTATGEYTVEIELSQPQATMEALDIPIVPKHIWEDVDDVVDFSNEDDYPIVGNGPWILTEYQRGESITLEANEDYWRGAPGFDRLVYRFYQDQDAAVEALKKGEVSLVPDLTPAQAESLEETDDITVNQADGNRFFAFTINPGAEAQNGEPIGDGHPALQDQEVRTAILHALDRDGLTDRVFGGYFEPSGSYIPPRYDKFHWAPGEDEVIEHDPDEANRILDRAGYERGDDGVRVSPDGDRLSFRFFVHVDDPQRLRIGEFVVEWMDEIGVEVEMEPSDDIGGILDSGEFDFLFTSWKVNPDPDYVLNIHTCKVLPEEPGDESYQSDAFFCDQQYDQFYNQQVTELDEDARADLVKQAQQRMYETGVVIVFGYPDMLEGYRSDQIDGDSILTQPEEGGNIYAQDGYWSLWSAEPAGDDEGGGAGSGLSGVVLGAGVGAAAVIVAGIVVLWRRRAGTVEERE